MLCFVLVYLRICCNFGYTDWPAYRVFITVILDWDEETVDISRTHNGERVFAEFDTHKTRWRQEGKTMNNLSYYTHTQNNIHLFSTHSICHRSKRNCSKKLFFLLLTVYLHLFSRTSPNRNNSFGTSNIDLTSAHRIESSIYLCSVSHDVVHHITLF